MSLLIKTTPLNDGTQLQLENLTSGYSKPVGSTPFLVIAGTINGEIARYDFSTEEADFIAQTPVIFDVSTITSIDSGGSGEKVYFPDDFYRAQVQYITGEAIDDLSDESTFAEFMDVQKLVNDKIVQTTRPPTKQSVSIFEMFIHLRALELLGNDPPISRENDIVSRISYLITKLTC